MGHAVWGVWHAGQTGQTEGEYRLHYCPLTEAGQSNYGAHSQMLVAMN